MSELEDEVEAINSIYGDGTLTLTEESGIYVLHLPVENTTLRIQFPADYPEAPPNVLGTQSSGEGSRKGDAAHSLSLFRDTLGRLWQPGAVCLFDAIEDYSSTLPAPSSTPLPPSGDRGDDVESPEETFQPGSLNDHYDDLDTPLWVVSDVVVEMKSVFVARCAPVTSPEQARRYVNHLLENDKKVAKATHNITAHRIKGKNGASFQDCDDDGETAAGGRLLHLMQLMNLWDVMVVVTRWYGGQKLGPARFGIINGVARDAFVKGGYVEQEDGVLERKKGKK